MYKGLGMLLRPDRLQEAGRFPTLPSGCEERRDPLLLDGEEGSVQSQIAHKGLYEPHGGERVECWTTATRNKAGDPRRESVGF